jgi:hypothetical protein
MSSFQDEPTDDMYSTQSSLMHGHHIVIPFMLPFVQELASLCALASADARFQESIIEVFDSQSYAIHNTQVSIQEKSSYDVLGSTVGISLLRRTRSLRLGSGQFSDVCKLQLASLFFIGLQDRDITADLR